MCIVCRRLWLSALFFLCASLIFFNCTEQDNILQPEQPTPPPSSLWEFNIDVDRGVPQGLEDTVDIEFTACSTAIGGFDLLLEYNKHALTFRGAELGQYFEECGWESFRYWTEPTTDSMEGHPSGLIRLVGLADGYGNPRFWDLDYIANARQEIIISLKFLLSNDRTLQCTTQPIRFFWRDCGDNTIYMPTGDSLSLNHTIADYNDTLIASEAIEFPGYAGVPDDPCLQGGGMTRFRAVDFVNGAIEFICYIIDNFGDINVNGVQYEFADAVMFREYFIYGLSVFTMHVAASTAASDCNENNITLELADLVYLIRNLVGDNVPNPQPIPDAEAALSMQDGTVSLESTDGVGAVLLVFDPAGDTTAPVIGVPDMDLKYGIVDDQLRVLIYDIGLRYIPAGRTDILSVSPTANLIEAEVAAYVGVDIPVSIVAVVSKTGPRNTRK